MPRVSLRFLVFISVIFNSACSNTEDSLASLETFYKQNTPVAKTCLQYAKLFSEAYDSLQPADDAGAVAQKLLAKHPLQTIAPENQPRYLQIISGISLISTGLRPLGREDSTLAFLRLCRLQESGIENLVVALGDVTPLDKAIRCKDEFSAPLARKRCIAASFMIKPVKPATTVPMATQSSGKSYCLDRVEKMPNLDRKLVEAADCGDVDLVRKLLDSGALITATDQQYRKSSLDYAVENGHAKVVELLISRGADVNRPTGDYSPLVYASISGNAELIDLLLKHGANPNHVYYLGDLRQTSLIAAVRHRRLEAVKALVAGGADVNFQNADGDTAIHLLVGLEGHPSPRDKLFIDYLLDHHADLTIKNNSGNTALDVSRPEAKKMVEDKLATR